MGNPKKSVFEVISHQQTLMYRRENILYFRIFCTSNYCYYLIIIYTIHNVCVYVQQTAFSYFKEKRYMNIYYSELLKIENSRSDEIVSYMPVVINKPWRCDIITNVNLNIGRPFSNR